MKKSLITKITALAVCSIVTLANAEKTTTLSPVTVISDTEKLTDSSDVINEAQLNKSPSNNANVIFNHISGVEFERSTVSGLGDIRIRGMGGMGSGGGTGQNRVAVNIDGVPLPDVFNYGHITRNTRATFDTADLKKVEIIKGPGLAGNGHSGIAGSVNFTTKDPKDYLQLGREIGGNVRTNYSGQDNNFAIGATLAGKINDNFSAMLSYTHRKFHEIENEGGLDTIGSERTANNPVDADSNNVLSKLVFSPNDNHEFKIKLEHFKQNYNSSLLDSKNPNAHDKSNSKRSLVSLRHNFNTTTPAFDNGYWQLYYQKNTQDRNDDLAYGISTGTTDYNVKSVGAEVLLNKFFGLHSVSYGLQYEKTNTKVKWFWDAPTSWGGPMNDQFQPNTVTKQVTTFINSDFSLANENLHILPSIKLTHYSIKPDSGTKNYKQTAPTSSQSKTKLSWALGASYKLNETNTVFASYRSGLRSPSFAELNSDTFHGKAIPNPNLKPEEVDGFELGINNDSDWGTHTLTAFRDNYSNIIAKKYTPQGSIKYNQDRPVIIYGLEYQGILNLDKVGLPNGMKLKTSLSYTRGKDKNNKQPYSPVNPFNGYVGLAYDSHSQIWGTELGVRFAAKKSVNKIAKNSILKPIGGYGVVDLSTYYIFNKNLHVNAGVYNLFNKKYATWTNYQNSDSYNKATEPGRFFAATVKYDF